MLLSFSLHINTASFDFCSENFITGNFCFILQSFSPHSCYDMFYNQLFFFSGSLVPSLLPLTRQDIKTTGRFIMLSVVCLGLNIKTSQVCALYKSHLRIIQRQKSLNASGSYETSYVCQVHFLRILNRNVRNKLQSDTLRSNKITLSGLICRCFR